MDASSLTVSPGQHSLTFDCSYASGEKLHAKLEVRLMCPPETIKGNLQRLLFRRKQVNPLLARQENEMIGGGATDYYISFKWHLFLMI